MTQREAAVRRQGHRLLQLGVALYLATSIEGFFVEHLASPMLARSAHSLCALVGTMFLVLGLVWPRLRLDARTARIALWLLAYSGIAIVSAFSIGAIVGAGHATMPLAGAPQGSASQELAIATVAYSSAPTGITAFLLILWGLRSPPDSRGD